MKLIFVKKKEVLTLKYSKKIDDKFVLNIKKKILIQITKYPQKINNTNQISQNP